MVGCIKKDKEEPSITRLHLMSYLAEGMNDIQCVDSYDVVHACMHAMLVLPSLSLFLWLVKLFASNQYFNDFVLKLIALFTKQCFDIHDRRLYF